MQTETSSKIDEMMIDGNADINPTNYQNTQPTPEEIAIQAEQSPPFLALHKLGKCCCEARAVEDGFAFRLRGCSRDTEWVWLREGDFNRYFDLMTEIPTGTIRKYKIQIIALQRMLDKARDCMSGKAIKRFARKTQKMFKGAI